MHVGEKKALAINKNKTYRSWEILESRVSSEDLSDCWIFLHNPIPPVLKRLFHGLKNLLSVVNTSSFFKKESTLPPPLEEFPLDVHGCALVSGKYQSDNDIKRLKN